MFKLNKRKAIPTRFKRRISWKLHPIFLLKKRQSSVVYANKSGMISVKIYERLIRRFRRYIKKRKYSMRFKFSINKIITKKPKNSRMGKGKGKLIGLLTRVSAGQVVAVCYGINYNKVTKFFKNESARSVIHYIVKPATMYYKGARGVF